MVVWVASRCYDVTAARSILRFSRAPMRGKRRHRGKKRRHISKDWHELQRNCAKTAPIQKQFFGRGITVPIFQKIKNMEKAPKNCF
jgi:hypothetical protein